MKPTPTLSAAATALAVLVTCGLQADGCPASTSCSSACSMTETTKACPASACCAEPDLFTRVGNADNFKTLAAAVKAAGLCETLQGKGPFTLFAPSDEAFKKLPAGTVENLLKPENRERLVAILKYHVVPGKVMAADVKTMSATTAQGQKLSIKVGADGVQVANAKVVKSDLEAANGVIHVIDTVLLPES